MEPRATPQRITISAHEAAAMMGVSESHIYRLINRGEMPGRKIGRRYVIHKAAFLTWLRGDQLLPASPQKSWLF